MSIYSIKKTWWADGDFGSDLFLKRDKLNKESQSEVKRVIEDSLEWIIENGLAKSIEVETPVEIANGIRICFLEVWHKESMCIAKLS